MRAKRTNTPVATPKPKLTPAEQAAQHLVCINEETPKVETFGTPGPGCDWKRSYIASLHGALASHPVAGIGGDEPWRERLADAWGDEHEAHQATVELRKKISSLIDRMTGALRTMDAGYRVNSLGEVQGSGMDVDRLCALVDYKTERAAQSWYRAIKSGAPLALVSEWGKKSAPKVEEVAS